MTRAVINSVGGKSRWLKQILPAFPDRPQVLVSPFLGGGSVELALWDKGWEVRGNDRHYPLRVCWNELRRDPSGFADRLQAFRDEHCPLDKERANEWKLAYFDLPANVSRADLAFHFFVAHKLSFCSILSQGRRRGVSSGATRTFPSQQLIWRVRTFLFPEAHGFHQVECHPYWEWLDLHPREFAYCDPPYRMEDVGKRNDLYGHNDDLHRDFDHERLAGILSSRPGGWVLSYNESEWVRDRYRGVADVHEITGTYNTKGSVGRRATELLIVREPRA